MKRPRLFANALLAGMLACLSLSALASLTPPPKEWAMFPQDEPPPSNAQNGAQAPGKGAHGNGQSDSNMGGIVSATNLRTGPQKDMPILWMLLTGALSLGALAACGGLILQKSAPELAEADDTPVVSEDQEVQA